MYVENYRIDSATAGYQFLLRNKSAQVAGAKSNVPVLFVHGATYGSTHTFDYAIDGRSWMDVLVADGFDVWCIDLLGYGGSDRPAEMDLPAEVNPPLVNTEHAVAEVNLAVDFIRELRNTTRVSLIGYSWGTAICGCYCGLYADKVARLVLSGALWVEAQAVKATNTAETDKNATPVPKSNTPSKTATQGAYRTVTAEAAAKRWAIGLSQVEIDALVPVSRVKQWTEDVVQCDPKANLHNPPQLRAPTGVMQDYAHCADTGEDWYDPSLIKCPTQIVVGENDRETTVEQGQIVFTRLTNAREKRFTVIGKGTHSLLLENNRHVLFEVVKGFLAS